MVRGNVHFSRRREQNGTHGAIGDDPDAENARRRFFDFGAAIFQG